MKFQHAGRCLATLLTEAGSGRWLFNLRVNDGETILCGDTQRSRSLSPTPRSDSWIGRGNKNIYRKFYNSSRGPMKSKFDRRTTHTLGQVERVPLPRKRDGALCNPILQAVQLDREPCRAPRVDPASCGGIRKVYESYMVASMYHENSDSYSIMVLQQYQSCIPATNKIIRIQDEAGLPRSCRWASFLQNICVA